MGWLSKLFGWGKEPDKKAIQKPIQKKDFEGAINLLPANRPIKEIIVHCAATPEGKHFSVETIREWHLQRGWNDIGYHYVVELDGTIKVGRPVSIIGAHCKGHNTGSIGVSYVGGVTSDNKTAKDTRTAAQRASLTWLVKSLAIKHKVTKISGHNQYAAKACPSFDVRKDELGNLTGFRNGLKVKR